jgi:hypothetical protein
VVSLVSDGGSVGPVYDKVERSMKASRCSELAGAYFLGVRTLTGEEYAEVPFAFDAATRYEYQVFFTTAESEYVVEATAAAIVAKFVQPDPWHFCTT